MTCHLIEHRRMVEECRGLQLIGEQIEFSRFSLGSSRPKGGGSIKGSIAEWAPKTASWSKRLSMSVSWR